MNNARVTGGLFVAATVLVNGAFVGLGTVFDYPQVLQQPPGQVLTRFAEVAVPVGGLFLLLATGAGLLAPLALGSARLAGPSRWSRIAAVTGVAAAAVQVAGLLRWPLLVPGLAATFTDPAASAADRAAAAERFALLGRVLGQVVGESAGYVLTAAFTVAILLAWRRRYVLPRVSTALALLAVPMILAGLLVPLGVAAADMVNFFGYVLWSLWTVSVGISLLRTRRPGTARRVTAAPAALVAAR